jgi:PPOX class probable F420-dependent enzyme
MTHGNVTALRDLPERIRGLLDSVRRGVMTTLDPDGSPHAVPVVFALIGSEIVSPIDHKPKSGVVMRRVKNLGRDDRVTLLIDDYDEDWTRLAWLMVRGRAIVDDDPDNAVMRALNTRYPQYEPDERHDALIRITPERLLWWRWS